MHVDRFEMETGKPAEPRTEPQKEDAAPKLQAAPRQEERRDDTPEEPGYGHGV
jgi:hypothetical protein